MDDYKELVENLRSVKDVWQSEEEQWMLDAADAIEELLLENDALGRSLCECDDLLKKLERPKWISVEERLPEDGVSVLAANDDGKMLVAKYKGGVFGWYLKYCCYDFDVWDSEENGPVTHWMPLPEPPKEVENER